MVMGLNQMKTSKNKKMISDSVLFKDFKVFIWLGPITMVTVYDEDTMVTTLPL